MNCDALSGIVSHNDSFINEHLTVFLSKHVSLEHELEKFCFWESEINTLYALDMKARKILLDITKIGIDLRHHGGQHNSRGIQKKCRDAWLGFSLTNNRRR